MVDSPEDPIIWEENLRQTVLFGVLPPHGDGSSPGLVEATYLDSYVLYYVMNKGKTRRCLVAFANYLTQIRPL